MKLQAGTNKSSPMKIPNPYWGNTHLNNLLQICICICMCSYLYLYLIVFVWRKYIYKSRQFILLCRSARKFISSVHCDLAICIPCLILNETEKFTLNWMERCRKATSPPEECIQSVFKKIGLSTITVATFEIININHKSKH